MVYFSVFLPPTFFLFFFSLSLANRQETQPLIIFTCYTKFTVDRLYYYCLIVYNMSQYSTNADVHVAAEGGFN